MKPMANTYSQVYVQCVFAVKYRDAIIDHCIGGWHCRESIMKKTRVSLLITRVSSPSI